MDQETLNEAIRLKIQAQQELRDLIIAEMAAQPRQEQEDARIAKYFFNSLRDARPAYTGRRKLILYISMHGHIISTPLRTHTHCQPEYYNRVKYASKSSPGTVAWGNEESERFEYNTIRRLYSSTNNDVFDRVRKELRRMYKPRMAQTKLENSQYTGTDPKLKWKQLSIQDNINDEAYTAQRGISTERNYWASFQPNVTNSYFSTNTNNKYYAKYGDYPENDEHRNIYVADAFGIPGLQLLDTEDNTLISVMQQIFTNINDGTTPLQKQFKLVKQKLEKLEPDIYLSDILNLMCVADIEVEIFDGSCSEYESSFRFLSAPGMKRLISEGETEYVSDDEFDFLRPNVDEESLMPQGDLKPSDKGGKSKKRRKSKRKKIKSKKASKPRRKFTPFRK